MLQFLIIHKLGNIFQYNNSHQIPPGPHSNMTTPVGPHSNMTTPAGPHSNMTTPAGPHSNRSHGSSSDGSSQRGRNNVPNGPGKIFDADIGVKSK